MNDELKAQLKKIVFEALTNAAEGDTAEEQYHTGPADCIAQDLVNCCSGVQEFVLDNVHALIQDDLEGLVEEWKAGQKRQLPLIELAVEMRPDSCVIRNVDGAVVKIVPPGKESK